MARPYANDLRRKFLHAYEQGKGTLGELAEQFGVSEGWAKKISSTRTRTGQIERPAWRRGPVSRVTAAVQAWLRRDINDQRRSDERADHRTGVEHTHREGTLASREPLRHHFHCAREITRSEEHT